jgi:Ca2+-binding EF-hand superfamily protein
MKKISLLVLIVLLPLACMTTPSGESPEVRGALDEVMGRWIEGLKTENLDLLMSAYWPEAELVMAGPEGEQVFAGFDAIAEFQGEGFRGSDLYDELVVSELPGEADPGGPKRVYEVGGPGFMMLNSFTYQERDGQWRIIRQLIEPAPMEPLAEGAIRVVSPLQEWADRDGNGVLEGPEVEELIQAIARLVGGGDGYSVENPLDEMFDLERDGRIDWEDRMRARWIYLFAGFRRLNTHNPDLARMYDLNDDGVVSNGEAWAFVDLIFEDEQGLGVPHDSHFPADRRMDANHDGFVDQGEIGAFRRMLLGTIASFPFGPQQLELIVGDKRQIWEWADLNQDGDLSGDEINDLGDVVRSVIRNPGLVRNLLDSYFDRNRDRHIGPAESERARELLYHEQLEHLLELDPEFTGPIVDVNSNGRIDERERDMLFEQLLARPEPIDPPQRRVSNALDQGIDRNGDGILEAPEQWHFMICVFGSLAAGWLAAPEQGMAADERRPVGTPLEELADLNGDGFVDPVEQRQLAEGLGSPHPVRSPFDRRIDFNGNGEVETFEIVKARRAGEQIAAEQTGVYPVRTLMDAHLDLNSDGQVDEKEMDLVLSFLSGDTQALNRNSKLYRVFDLNDDRRITENELVEGIDRYLLPHPVNVDEPLDRDQDRNRDGFLDPGEIGIAAGVSARGDILTIPERLERREWQTIQAPEETSVETEQQRQERYESEFYKKLGQIQDRKLAVVGITSGTKTIDEETTSGVMVFIENAFVNVGKVRVVDRQNIAKIVKEYEFQASDLTDETTAVEIGKLSGADIIVIGSISFVGNIYYLNIKLISVETAEIIGSSIADAQNTTEFFDMCNEAVFTLF